MSAFGVKTSSPRSVPSSARAVRPPPDSVGRRPNGFLRLSLNDQTILFLVILLDKTVSVE